MRRIQCQPRNAALILLLSVIASCAPVSAQLIPDGFAAMGASETQGTTFTGSWVPYAARDRGLNFGGLNEPYNVAVGGATSVTLLSQGQHTTVRNLIQAGSADASYFMIGANDFNAVALQIAGGTLSGAGLTNFITGVVNNMATALDTVLSAQPTGVVVVGLPELMLTPGGRAIFDTPVEIARGRAAIDQTNAAIQSMATARFLPVVDLARAQRDIEALPSFLVGGVTIDRAIASSNPRNLFQDAIHPGAVGNGLLANLFDAGMNVAYGTTIAPLTDLEVLTRAGIAAEYTGDTFSSTMNFPQYVTYPQASNVAVASLNTSSAVVFNPTAQGSVLADAGDGLLSPLDVRYDTAGNLLVADVLRSRVTRITPAGVASVFADAADGAVTPSGLAIDAGGNVIVANYLTNTLVKVTPAGVGTVFADAADGLASPFGVAVDNLGQTYVADLGHSRVLRFDAAGNSTVFADAGDGLLAPLDVEIGPDGRIYVADVLNSRVTRFTPAGVGATFADAADGLTTPSGLTFDNRGNLVVSNYLSDTLVHINPYGRAAGWADAGDGISSPFGIASRPAGGGPAALAVMTPVPEPSALALALLAAVCGHAALRRRCRGPLCPAQLATTVPSEAAG